MTPRTRWLITLGIALALTALAWSQRFIQDDAYISFIYARHFIEGGQSCRRYPVIDDLEIGRLIAGVEPKDETESIGQRELLFENLAQMKLARFVNSRLSIFFHRFG